MNKNGERTKLLAVIAVFAMVACALVAFAPVADADVEANSYTDVDNGYTISAAGYDNLSFDKKDGKVIVTGYAGYATDSDALDSTTKYGDLFGTATGKWAYAIISGFDDSAKTLQIVQTNDALKTAYPDDDNLKGGVKTSTRTGAADIADGYAFLIPVGGSKVVTLQLTYTYADNKTETVTLTYDFTGVEMGNVIDSADDITSGEISTATIWILSKNVTTDEAFTLSEKLTIADSANGGSLTIEASDASKAAITAGSANAAIDVVGTTLTVKNAADVTMTTNSVIVNGSNKLVITGTDAIINFSTSGSKALNYVAEGATMEVVLNDSTMNVSGNGGVQTVLIKADGSTVDATGLTASLSAYFDLNESVVKGANINAYSANLVKSSINATGFFGVYTGKVTAPTFTNSTKVSTTGSVSVDADSSVVAKTVYDSLTNSTTSKPTGTPDASKTATFTGKGSITGDFTTNRTDTTAKEFTLDGGITLTGNSSVAADVNVDAKKAIVGADASLDVAGAVSVTSLQVLNGATVTSTGTGAITVETEATYEVSSEASVSAKVDGITGEVPVPKATVTDETTFLDAVEKQYDEIIISGNVVVNTDDVYIADWMTVTIPNGASLTFGTAPATTGAGEYFTNDGKYVVEGILNIVRDGENNGLIEIRGGIINITGAANIDELKDCSPVFENNGAIIVYGTKADKTTAANYTDASRGTDVENIVINVTKSGLLSNNGSIAAETEALSRAVAVSGTGWVENGNNGTIGILVNAAHVEGLSYEVNLSQDISGPVTYPSYQTVIVPEGTTLAIKNSATVVINGKMIVNGTLVIEGGEYTSGKLIIAGGSADAQAASLEINGAITVQDGGALVIGDAGKGNATVTGSLTAQDGSNVDVLNGKMDVTGTLDLQTNSKLKVVAYTDDTTPYGVLSVQSAGTVNVNGYIDDVTGAVITNYGAITIANGACDVSAKQFGSLTVNMAASGATVTVESFLMDDATELKITDAGLVLYTDRNDNKTTVVEAAANTVTVNGLDSDAQYGVVSGLVVTENTTSKLNSNGTTRTFTNSMAVSGTFGVSLTYAAGTAPTENDPSVIVLTLDGGDAKVAVTAGQTTGGVDVTETLSTGNFVKLVNSGDLDVTGTVSVGGAVDDKRAFNNIGVIDVTGAGIVTVLKNAIDNDKTINAAYYVIKNGTGANEVTYHNYATLETAVPAVADAANTNTSKVITIMGAVKVTENLDVPAGISIVFETNRSDANSLTIGSTKDRDVTVTMAVGSKMTSGNGQVIVEGTLVFTDKTNDATKNTVSDVTVEDESKNGSRTYTNIYTALANATDGQTVEVTRTTGNVVLGQSVTIPAGVTLYVPERTASLLLEDGVTLTVDGTLETEMDVLAETKFGTTAKDATVGDNPKSSAVVVNGTVLVADNLKATVYGNGVATDSTGATPVYSSMLDGAPIYGAYYIVDGYYVISTLEIALADVADIVGDIVVNGPVTVGDVTFAATEDCTAVVISDKTVTDMSEPAKTVSTILTAGSVTVVGGTFGDVDNGVYTNGTFTGDIVVGDARVTASNVVKLVVTDDEDDGMVIAGTPDFVGKTGALTVAAGTVTATSALDAEMSVTVAAGATLVSEGAQFDDLFVNGNVTVASGKAMTADYLYVNGTGVVSIAAATDNSTAGSVTVGCLFMGIAPGDIVNDKDLVTATPGAATVTGPIAYGVALVLDEAVIDESNIADKDSTTFHVDGAVWFTAYAAANSEVTVTVNKAPVENAILAGWSATENGDAITSGNAVVWTFDIGAEDRENLYAVVEYDIYTITIYANEAVDDIFIDGQIMQKGMFGNTDAGFVNGYQLVIAAGSHTISYTLANGYSGEGVVSVVYGDTTASGVTFTTAGTDAEDMNIVLQLTGFEKTGYVPESPDTGSSDDSGMGITDYLLIVLVVLIIVMAIIVAMRLMRS